MELASNETPIFKASPIEQTERIILLYSPRGIAIPGILLMNVPGFGLPFIAIQDLSILGEVGKPDMVAWILFDGIFEGTMRALFSMLFGAGMFLFIGRLETRSQGVITAEIYFRRQICGFINRIPNRFRGYIQPASIIFSVGRTVVYAHRARVF